MHRFGDIYARKIIDIEPRTEFVKCWFTNCALDLPRPGGRY